MTNRVDNFNRTDSAVTMGTPSDGGSAWAPNSGTWGISSNTGYCAVSTSQVTTILESSIADCDIQVTLSTVGASTDSGACFRSVDDSNYLIFTATVSGNTYKCFKRVTGSFTQIGSTFSVTPASADVLKLTANGNSITARLNGSSIITATESFNATATKHGLRSNVDIQTRFEDFSVTALGGASRPVKMAGQWGGFAGESGGFAG